MRQGNPPTGAEEQDGSRIHGRRNRSSARKCAPFSATSSRRALAEKVKLGKRLTKEDMEGWHAALNARGWLAPNWPREWGGAKWTAIQNHIFDEEAWAAGAPRVIPFGINMLGPVLIKFGSQAQKEHFLPRILDGTDWWCQGYSEPGAGSDLASLKTRAERAGRPLHRQRPEDLDDARPLCRLDLLPRAHLDGRQAAGRHFLPADRHEVARRDRAPDHPARRRARGERGLLRQRQGAGGQSRRQGERGLDLRQVSVDA